MGAVFYIRFIRLARSAAATLEYSQSLRGGWQDVSRDADLYNWGIRLDGLVFALIVFRLLWFTSINRQTFVLWRALSQAMEVYDTFILVFVPCVLGLICVSWAMLHTYHLYYRTWWISAVSTLMHLQTFRSPVAKYHEEDVGVKDPWRVLGVVLAWAFIVRLLMLNTWVGVLTNVYQKNRVRHGYRPDEYKWSEIQYADFFLWAQPKKIYYRIRRIHIAKKDDEEDET